MWLFVIAEKIRKLHSYYNKLNTYIANYIHYPGDPEGKSSETLLKVIMVTLSVVVLLSFLVNIAILSTYGGELWLYIINCYYRWM